MKFHYQFNVDNIKKLNAWHGQGLIDFDQIVLMRWFLDFAKTGKMDRLFHTDEKFYYRVSHPYLASQFDAFPLSERTIRRKLKDLCNKNILVTAVINEGMQEGRHGTKAGYSFNPEALAILSPQEHEEFRY